MMLRKLRIALAAAFTAAGVSGTAGPPDWPQWHGPGRDNISRETGLLKQWPEGGPPLAWKASGLGIGFSTVAITNGAIYTAGVLSNETFVIALDLQGQIRWKVPNGRPWVASPGATGVRNNDGARATPTVNDGLVYYLNELGSLSALDAISGKSVWTLDIAKTFGAAVPQWAYAESVLIDGNSLICYPGGTNGYMVALDKKTGKTVWANTDIGDPASYCSAILVEDQGVRQVITMTAQAVIGVDADTGRLLWRQPHANKRAISPVTPLYHQGSVYVTCGYGAGGISVRLTFKGKDILSEKTWAHLGLDNHHGGVILLDGHIYGAGHEKPGWYCLEFASGKEVYRDQNFEKGSLTCADGMFYCFGENGTMGLVTATPKGFRLISQFKVPPGGEGLYWAHPVVCGGRLYVRHANVLYAYDIKAR